MKGTKRKKPRPDGPDTTRHKSTANLSQAKRAQNPWLGTVAHAFDRVIDRIPFLVSRRQPSYTRLEVLQSIPFRNERIEWEVVLDTGSSDRKKADTSADGIPVVVLRVPRRQDRLGRMMNRFFEGPEYRQVILDELGTDVWQLCDGEASIEQMIQSLARKHKLERREVEISLTTYLKTLAKRGFVGLRVPNEEMTGQDRR